MKKVIVKWNKRHIDRHLWIFSNDIISDLKTYEKGDLVKIVDQKGKFRGTGYINPNSLIAIRILSYEDEEINKDFFKKRINDAVDYRTSVGATSFDSYRVIFGEADGLPGLIVDKYDDYLSVQILTAGMEKLFSVLKDVLIETFSPRGIILRNDAQVREMEGLRLFKEICYGKIDSMPIINEDGVLFKVDLLEGQKTGFFLDQRANRLYLRKLLKERSGAKILDCFSYSGGWALSSAFGKNNNVTAVEISDKACHLIKENANLNELNVKVEKADVFDYLKQKYEIKERYDLIILDPPAFIKSRAKIKEGVKGYKEINVRAMKLLNKGGILVTSSCSYHISKEGFLEMLKDAAGDCKKTFRIIKMGGQSEDHPVLLSMRETDYLKTFFLVL